MSDPFAIDHETALAAIGVTRVPGLGPKSTPAERLALVQRLMRTVDDEGEPCEPFLNAAQARVLLDAP